MPATDRITVFVARRAGLSPDAGDDENVLVSYLGALSLEVSPPLQTVARDRARLRRPRAGHACRCRTPPPVVSASSRREESGRFLAPIMTEVAMQRRFVALCAALSAVLFFMAVTASAQGTLGRLVGTVLDSSGGALPGATLTLSNVGTGFRAVEVTNSQGAFTFSQIPVGTYKVVVEQSGSRQPTSTT